MAGRDPAAGVFALEGPSARIQEVGAAGPLEP